MLALALPRCIDYKLTIDRPSKVFSRIRKTFSHGIWNPGNVFFWNPESWALESGIQLKEPGIKQQQQCIYLKKY